MVGGAEDGASVFSGVNDSKLQKMTGWTHSERLVLEIDQHIEVHAKWIRKFLVSQSWEGVKVLTKLKSENGVPTSILALSKGEVRLPSPTEFSSETEPDARPKSCAISTSSTPPSSAHERVNSAPTVRDRTRASTFGGGRKKRISFRSSARFRRVGSLIHTARKRTATLTSMIRSKSGGRGHGSGSKKMPKNVDYEQTMVRARQFVCQLSNKLLGQSATGMMAATGISSRDLIEDLVYHTVERIIMPPLRDQLLFCAMCHGEGLGLDYKVVVQIAELQSRFSKIPPLSLAPSTSIRRAMTSTLAGERPSGARRGREDRASHSADTSSDGVRDHDHQNAYRFRKVER